jgi:hypothetical protein
MARNENPMFENPTRATYETILRQDFSTFAARCFYDLNPQTDLAINWHLEVIAAKLADVRQGKIRRLIINLPPRSLKSLMASIAFPAWCLGHDPSAQILCVSYPQDLADKLARLPQHHDEPVVPADLSDPPGSASSGRAGVHHHPPGIPPRHLQWWCADRTGCRHHPDR